MTVVTCSKIFGKPPWLKEWLTYQRTLGVDHVHFDAEDSFIPNSDLKVFLDELMNEGFLSIDIWKKYLNSQQLWYHNQGLIYEDWYTRLVYAIYQALVLSSAIHYRYRVLT